MNLLKVKLFTQNDMKHLQLIFLLLISLIISNTVLAQDNLHVKGAVVSSQDKTPLKGINVSLENYSLEEAISTNEKGEFQITVPNGEVTLVFTYPGFNSQRVFLDGRTAVNISLAPDYYANPNRVVKGVPGVNTLDRINGAIVNLDKSELHNVNKTSFDAMTQGVVSGVYSTTRSGMPGAYSDMIVRGASSFSGTGAPLVIVDGLIYRSEEYPAQIIENGQLDIFADLNPNDIESLTILKEAAATAIYGSRGANGVILINTHQGEVGKTKMEFSSVVGMNSSAGKELKLLNADQHRLFGYEQLFNSGWDANQIATEYPNFLFNTPGSNGYERYNNNTSWNDEIYDDSAIFQDYYFRISGGDQKASYALSLSNRSEEAIISNSDLNRFSARLNVDYKLSEKLKYGNYLSISHITANQIEQGNSLYNPVLLAISKTPTMTPYVQNSRGGNTVIYDNYGELNQTNPVALINTQDMTNQRDQLNVLAYLEFEQNSNWFYKMNVGMVLEDQKEAYFIPGNGVVPVGGKSRISGRSVSNYFSLNNDWLASYTKKEGSHFINVNAKINLQATRLDVSSGEDINANTDYQTTLDGDIDFTGYKEHNVNNLSFLLSSNYIFQEKYFATLNASVDASSRFGSENPVGFFPSLSAGWRVSNEDFLRDSEWINKLQVNTSLGLVGNSDNLPLFQTRAFYTPGNYINYGGVVKENLANPSLKWETTREFTLGADLISFNNKLNVEVNYYNRLTSDIVVPTEVSPVTGVGYVQLNGAEVLNQGVELSANVWLVDNNSFKWWLGSNLTFNKNEVKKLPGGKDIQYSYNGVQTILREGESIGSFYGFETMQNVYSSNSEIDLINDGYAPFQAGDLHYVNQDGNDVIDKNDQKVLGNGYADVYGGINTGISMGDLEFSMLFDFRAGNEIWNATRHYSESMSTLNNQSTAVLNRWSQEGDISNIPRAALGDPTGNGRASDRWVEDGSFFRLRNIKLGYNFKKVFRGMKVYVAADNLLTFSNYLGAYPEVNATGNLLMQGVDFGNVPQTKSVMLGINLSL